MIRSLADIISYPAVDSISVSPCEPALYIRLKLNMKHSVDKCAGHGFYYGCILCSVSRADYNTSLRKMVFSNPSFVDKAIEGLLQPYL